MSGDNFGNDNYNNVVVPKKRVFDLNLWEGDKLFLRYMDEKRPFFSLKLKYTKGELVEAVLDGVPV